MFDLQNLLDEWWFLSVSTFNHPPTASYRYNSEFNNSSKPADDDDSDCQPLDLQHDDGEDLAPEDIIRMALGRRRVADALKTNALLQMVSTESGNKIDWRASKLDDNILHHMTEIRRYFEQIQLHQCDKPGCMVWFMS